VAARKNASTLPPDTTATACPDSSWSTIERAKVGFRIDWEDSGKGAFTVQIQSAKGLQRNFLPMGDLLICKERDFQGILIYMKEP
jgi:hypothetical protein